jgi:hypothetical protein
MACILVFTLLITEASSSVTCQIVVLHTQSKRRYSMAALQPLHD